MQVFIDFLFSLVNAGLNAGVFLIAWRWLCIFGFVCQNVGLFFYSSLLLDKLGKRWVSSAIFVAIACNLFPIYYELSWKFAGNRLNDIWIVETRKFQQTGSLAFYICA